MSDTAFDLSSNNGNIPWGSVTLDPSVKLIISKCTEGVSYADPFYIANKAAARNRGLRVGSYHFARPDNNPADVEATYFCNHVGDIKDGDIVALDFEHAANKSPSEMVSWAQHWCEVVQGRLNITPVFYTYRGFIDGPLGGNAALPLTKYPLWLAAYQTNAPRTSPWSSMFMWQFTDHTLVNGIHGYVDQSVILGGTFVKVPNQTNIHVPSPQEVKMALNADAVAIKLTATGQGYWVVAADGGVFAYGDAQFHGSMGGQHLNKPIVGFDAKDDNTGYALLGQDGGVFAYGSVPFLGSPA